MADDEIVKVLLELDPGNSASEAAQAGKQISDALSAAIKPQIDLSQIGKATREAMKGAAAPLGEGISKSIKDHLSEANLGKIIEGAISRPTTLPSVSVSHPAPAISEAPEVNLTKRIQPFLSAMESVSMLLRGAPITSTLQMVGQTLRDFQEARQRIDPRAIQFPGGRPGETEAARVERRLGAVPGAAAPEAGVAEGAAGGLLARMGLSGGAAAGGAVAIAATAYGLTKINQALAEMALKSADTTVRFHSMTEVMGMTSKELLETGLHFAKSGVNVGDFENALYRLALTARREMPLVKREIADSANVIEESNLKVQASERGVEKARDERQASTENVTKAEGELVKVQATGVDVQQQQARAAELAISGAQIGLRGAQMRTRQAAVNLQFAPEEARLADIQGPLTVEGARLGRRGAGIAAEEAGARYRKFMYGEEEDPDVVEQRRFKKERLLFDQAIYNRDQADAREQAAEIAERKRVTMKAAGVGPEAQAEQQALQAAQEQEQAKLRVQQVVTAQRRLEIDQEHNTVQMQTNAADRALLEAKRGVPASEDAEKAAKIDLDRATKRRDLEKYEQIPSVEHAIRATIAGKPEEGYKFEQVPVDVQRKAFENLGDFKVGGPGGILDLLAQFQQAQKAQGVEPAARLETTGALFRGRGIQGAQLQELQEALETPREKLTEKQSKLVERWAKELDAALPKAKDIRAEREMSRQRGEMGEFEAGVKAFPAAEGAIKYNEQLSDLATQAQGHVAGFISALDRLENWVSGHAKDVTPKKEPAVEELKKPAEELKKPVEVEAKTPVPVEQAKPSVSVEQVKPPVPAEQPKPIIAPSQQGALTGPADNAAAALSKVAGAAESAASALSSVKAPAQAAPPAPSGGGEQTAVEQQHGGLLHGPGTGTSDSIPIMASAGEYVIKADSVAKLGVGRLDALNEGRVGFAEGGIAGGSGQNDKPKQDETARDYSARTAKKPKWEPPRAQQSSSDPAPSPPPEVSAPGETGSNVGAPADSGVIARIPVAGMPVAGMPVASGQIEGFAEGGSVDATQTPTASERQAMVDAGLDPDDLSPATIQWLAARRGQGKRGSTSASSAPTGGGAIAYGKIEPIQVKHGPAAPLKITHAGDPLPGMRRVGDTLPGTRRVPDTGGTRPSITPFHTPEQQTRTPTEQGDSAKPARPAMTEEAALAGETSTSPTPQSTTLEESTLAGEPREPKAPVSTEPTSVNEKISRGEVVTNEEYNTWMKDVGPKMGGWTPILPPTSKEAPATPLGPGDYIIRKGGRGDQNYFGGNDYAIPSRKYPGGSDVERPARGKRSEADDTAPSTTAEAGIPADIVGAAEGGVVSDDAQQVAFKADPGAQEQVAPEFGPGSKLLEESVDPIPSRRIPEGMLDKEAQSIQPRGLHLPRPIPGSKVDPDQPPPGEFYQGFERREQHLAEGGRIDISQAITHLVRGFAGGGLVGGFTNTVAHIPGYANGGSVASPSNGNGGNTLGYHQLDLRTNAGSFTANVSEDTMRAIRNSSLNGKLTRTSNQFPTWYS